MANQITAERLLELLVYNPDTGIFVWRKNRPGCTAGARAGAYNDNGYLRIQIDGRIYAAHRLAWLYMHGVWPADQLDHRNLCKADNRIANLREVTNSQNQQNTNLRANNTSGFRGVWFCKKRGLWEAKIVLHNKRHRLGYYATAEAASRVYEDAAAHFHSHRTDRTAKSWGVM